MVERWSLSSQTVSYSSEVCQWSRHFFFWGNALDCGSSQSESVCDIWFCLWRLPPPLPSHPLLKRVQVTPFGSCQCNRHKHVQMTISNRPWGWDDRKSSLPLHDTILRTVWDWQAKLHGEMVSWRGSCLTSPETTPILRVKGRPDKVTTKIWPLVICFDYLIF